MSALLRLTRFATQAGMPSCAHAAPVITAGSEESTAWWLYLSTHKTRAALGLD
ncbi:hypothetical protein LJ656_01420 [Paraburkholderia sp. MMS20-SJTR3]|uniref:Uncharacterized protein n=1 Tax=Paraburkholderia sejongensis TaxID=2886946 RepID=A0ABS8JMW1_9BURK|nr:hypothetical protein [Paraburkholderia sp. MMS20-SJTR3]MCC8391234.1 hypothetical protein [Paraburkholderia sp. MMS20-SJTR3]